jgi:hypothetical protein
MAIPIMSIEEMKKLSAEDIKGLTSIKCLMSCLGQGANGRKVETSEVKNLSKEERDSLADECRKDLVAVAQV